MCVCACVCVGGGGGGETERAKAEENREREKDEREGNALCVRSFDRQRSENCCLLDRTRPLLSRQWASF